MQYHKVELCGVNTAKLPVLKEKEKAALLRAVKNGDEEARQKMINGNLRLVLICFRWAASALSRPLIISTQTLA